MYDRVHFEGKWPEPEVELVSAAIWRAEARLSASPSPTFGKTWICVREQVDDSSVLYAASRFGYHETLKALSASALSGHIDEFGEVAQPYA